MHINSFFSPFSYNIIVVPRKTKQHFVVMADAMPILNHLLIVLSTAVSPRILSVYPLITLVQMPAVRNPIAAMGLHLLPSNSFRNYGWLYWASWLACSFSSTLFVAVAVIAATQNAVRKLDHIIT